MTREEAKAYFEKCNDGIITASKDENVYDYEKQEIMSVFMRRTYEANVWAISALSENKGEWIAQDIHNCCTVFKCSKCGYEHNFLHLYGKPTADYPYCPDCGARMKGGE